MKARYGLSRPGVERCKHRNHGGGDCPHYETMKARFLRRGDWVGCAGCCQMCIERRTCELACAVVAQITIFDYEEV